MEDAHGLGLADQLGDTLGGTRILGSDAKLRTGWRPYRADETREVSLFR